MTFDLTLPLFVHNMTVIGYIKKALKYLCFKGMPLRGVIVEYMTLQALITSLSMTFMNSLDHCRHKVSLTEVQKTKKIFECSDNVYTDIVVFKMLYCISGVLF